MATINLILLVVNIVLAARLGGRFFREDSLYPISFGLLYLLFFWPFGLWLASRFLDFEQSVIASGLVMLVILSVFQLGLLRHSSNFNWLEQIKRNLSEYKIVALLAVVALALTGYFAFSYPFLYGLDGYKFLRIAEHLIQHGFYPTSPSLDYSSVNFPYAPLLSYFAAGVSYVSVVEPFQFFRVVGPLIFSLSVIPIYQLITRFTKSHWLSFFGALLWLLTPAVAQELLFVRPQLALFFVTPLSLVLLIDYGKRRHWLIPALVAVLAIFGLLYHTFLTVTLLVPLAMTLVFVHWHQLVLSGWKKLVLYGIIALAVLLPYYFWLDLPRNYGWLFNIIFEKVGPVTWQSPYSLKTYLATLGPLMVFAFWIWAPFSRELRKQLKFWVVLSYTFVFFFLLEIFTRLGYSFLPDRAFVFIPIGLLPLVIFACDSLRQGWLRYKVPLAAITFLAALTIAGSLWILWQRPGAYVSRAEYEAAQFLREHTEKGAAVIAQSYSYPVVNYFGHRNKIEVNQSTLERVYLAQDSAAAAAQIELLQKSVDLQRSRLLESWRLAGKQVEEIILNPNTGKEGDFSSRDSISHLLADFIRKANSFYGSIPVEQFWANTIYVLYSKDRFTKAFADDQYNKENFKNANLSSFEDTIFFEKVFENSAVSIWRYIPAEQRR